jgi:cytochrome c oxidase cbb3-type subunit 2
MRQFPAMFGGIFAAFAVSFIGMVMVPKIQLASLQPQVDEDAGDIYPINVGGEPAQGRAVYISEGCIACHSQQVRDSNNGPDLDRGWGERRTVARDYIYDQPALLGTMRIGPDLANVGARKDKEDPGKYTPEWHYLHLYNARGVVKDSMMPSYSFLFETRKIVGQRSADALQLTGKLAPEAGYEVVPTRAARSLVAYLLSLDHSHPLKEAGPNLASPQASPAGGAKK